MKQITKEQRGAQFAELFQELEAWEIPEDAVDSVHDLARASLNEVKALTEYEDGKVSRLMTVVAFLSAVVGAVFTRFASQYSWPGTRFCGTATWLLPFLTYLIFIAYVTLVTVAVLVLIYAIRPRFNLPRSFKGDGRSGLPPSMLFYEKILDVSAKEWGRAFIAGPGHEGKKLKAYYAKCYIREAYLVAGKVADKLRIVDPGVQALQWAMGVLLLFFLFFAATLFFVTPTKAADGTGAPTVEMCIRSLWQRS